MSTPEADLASMSRAAQRKMRLVEIERQQHLEDLEALKMTEVSLPHNATCSHTYAPLGTAPDAVAVIPFC